ncbi:hypothetical protein Zmor_018085 [Zophobas morio]|uniref:sn-1-specific diacylglycerol lipase ABHD11 n=1 Tax=Zophobas morio TaxID=2755281 RepID=A0AA38MDL4_9CUCU|nr:hypothetical protein Zmor_018085 [Zophobas morio]
MIFQKLTVISNSKFAVRALSQLQPVRLAYAAYESTSPIIAPSPIPLIVNHGLFGSKANWNSLCKVYHNKTNRKVIAVDARNHGDSPHTPQHSYEYMVADLKYLIENLNFSKVALLGHSMGGRAVMLFALKYPSLVERLIVADISPVTTSPNLKTMPGLFGILKNVQLPHKMPLSTARAQIDSYLARSLSDKGLRSFLLTNLIQVEDGSYSWRINIPALMSNFGDIAKFPATGNMTYSGPVLFIGGGKSDYIQRSDEAGIKRFFPNAELKYIEGAGHWLHSEKPTEFLQDTVHFLNKS